MLRGLNTLNMIVVGIVFYLLLSGLKDVEFTAVPWDNTVLHYIIPVAVALDRVVDRPAARIGFARAMVWMLYPAGYLSYSLIRGHLVGWYPYPFLDPRRGGYGEVAITSMAVTLGTAALVWMMAQSTGRKATAV